MQLGLQDSWTHFTIRKMAEWKLIYWYYEKPPLAPFPGRGEYIRLMFEETGVPYEDVCKKAKNYAEVLAFMRGEKPGFPVHAPPYIQHGDFVMNQTPAIMEYLGKKFNMYPTGGPEEEAHAAQLNQTTADYHSEGNLACHPVNPDAPATTQMEEAKVTIKRYCEKRLPRYSAGSGGGAYMTGVAT